MFLQQIKSPVLTRPLFTFFRKYSTDALPSEPVEVEYPPVKGRYPPGQWTGMDEKWAWEQWGRRGEQLDVPKARERLEHVAQEKEYYLYKTLAYDQVPRTLEYKQYITKSCYVNSLPDKITNINVDSELQDLQSLVTDAVVQEEHHYKHFTERSKKLHEVEKPVYKTKYQMHHFLNTIKLVLSSQNDHLLRSQTDKDVNVDTFWSRYGFKEKKKFVPGRDVKEGIATFQYSNKPSYQIRTELPLPEIVDRYDDLCTKGSVPNIDYAPAAIGQNRMLSRPFSISGHVLGDPCEFGLLSCHLLPPHYHQTCVQMGPKVAEEQILQHGITASFAWCVSQALNQGFGSLLELTYPLSTQTMITDGQNVRFFAYQLNTLELWKSDDANPLRNVCWVSPPMPLFRRGDSGLVEGVHTDALRVILQMFLNKPADRGMDLRPYLPEDAAPRHEHLYINHKGDKPIERPKIERWQYPRKSLYF